jgi:hypothetical protein
MSANCIRCLLAKKPPSRVLLHMLQGLEHLRRAFALRSQYREPSASRRSDTHCAPKSDLPLLQIVTTRLTPGGRRETASA